MCHADVLSVLRKAIRTRTPIRASYKDGRHRLLSPHVLGMTGGRWRVLCYQSSGATASGLSVDARKNWRCFTLRHLHAVRIDALSKWRTAGNHSQTQRCVEDIDTAVLY